MINISQSLPVSSFGFSRANKLAEAVNQTTIFEL
jgi:hypothetical protein